MLQMTLVLKDLEANKENWKDKKRELQKSFNFVPDEHELLVIYRRGKITSRVKSKSLKLRRETKHTGNNQAVFF